MKNLLILLALVVSLTATAQFDYGFVGGINFQASGDLTTAASQDLTNLKETAQRRMGYYAGVYGQVKFLMFYLRPEIHYNQLNSSFETLDTELSTKNIEAPISVGYTFIPSLSVFAGPSFQYRLQEELSKNTIESIGSDTSVGAHLGVRFSLNKFALDLRYERGFKESEIDFLTNQGVNATFDARGQKWTLGFSISLD